MRKSRAAGITVLGLLFLSGCLSITRYDWVNPELTPEQVSRDKDECREVAEIATIRGTKPFGDLVGTDPAKRTEEYDKCMVRKGYIRQYYNRRGNQP